MRRNLTEGSVAKGFFAFSLPLVVANLLQQCYSLADMFIVGYALGSDALAAVGSSFTLTSTMTALILGLCMGAGALVSYRFGQNDERALEETVASSFALCGLVSVALLALSFISLGGLQTFLDVPDETWWYMMAYLQIVFTGIVATFAYSFFACLVRALGDSFVPFVILSIASASNIGFDVLFTMVFDFGAAGAGWATVVAQYVSAAAMALYAWKSCPEARSVFHIASVKAERVREIARYSGFTCFEQLLFGLGAMAVQPFVNAAGDVAVAGYAIVVKIQTLAISPLQGFGKAFCTYVSQNRGAGNVDRVQEGARVSFGFSAVFAFAAAVAAYLGARVLIALAGVVVDVATQAWIVNYLRVSCPFYIVDGCLFIFAGYFRGDGAPELSTALAAASLLARIACVSLGEAFIAWSAPVGWIVAAACAVWFRYLRHARGVSFGAV